MSDLNSRIKQLTKPILTSTAVNELEGGDSSLTSPLKLDFDLSLVQRHVWSEFYISCVDPPTTLCSSSKNYSRRQNEAQATQILSLEAALLEGPELPADAPKNEKDMLIAEQTKTPRARDCCAGLRKKTLESR